MVTAGKVRPWSEEWTNYELNASFQALHVFLNKKPPGTPERGQGEHALLLPFSWGSRGNKSALLNAMICFLIVNMIQRRSTKIIYMTVRGIAYDIPKKVPRMPSISGVDLLA